MGRDWPVTLVNLPLTIVKTLPVLPRSLSAASVVMDQISGLLHLPYT
jgi:hypothetical protein